MANRYIPAPSSLVTTYEQTRAGFLDMAFEKSRQAVPFVEEAKAFKAIASSAKTPADLRHMHDISPALLIAAGVSNKAMNHLQEPDRQKAIDFLIEEILTPAGDNFIDELTFRFLLTSGDALGGKMRNLAGTLGEWKFTRAVISSLSIQSKPFHYLHSDTQTRTWRAGDSQTPHIEQFTRGLSWQSNAEARTLLYNRTVPPIQKNVDLCLLRSDWQDTTRKTKNPSPLADSKNYIALGELKSGIDPAGADEHWKTAKSSLERIRTGFKTTNADPLTFFVGAAIEVSMAQEIYNDLQNQILSNAANLTNDNQLAELCYWLTNL